MFKVLITTLYKNTYIESISSSVTTVIVDFDTGEDADNCCLIINTSSNRLHNRSEVYQVAQRLN